MRVIFAPDETKVTDPEHWGWENYTKATRKLLYDRIVEIENA